MKIKNKEITTWTRYKKINCKIFFPDNVQDIVNILKKNKNLLACGNLRSYNDVCLNKNLVNLKKLNKILEFKKNSGIISVQSGCLLSDMLKTTLNYNWFIPVSPGTKFVTIGGMVANNIHGKRTSKNFFSDHLVSFRIIKTDGKIVECSRNKNLDLFNATLGGIGLTGIILDVKLKLQKIKNENIYINRKFYSNYDFLNFEKKTEKYEYSISWLSSFRLNGKVKCIHFLANHSKNHKKKFSLSFLSKRKKINFIHKFIFKILNNFYLYRLVSLGFYLMNRFKGNNIEHLNNFFYAQDKFIDWPKLYGKKGFFEFHILVPQVNVIKFLNKFYDFCQTEKVYSNLIVAKKFNLKKNSMKFRDNGFSFSFDFSNNKKKYKIKKFFFNNKKYFDYSFNPSKDLFFNENHVKLDKSYEIFKKQIKKYNRKNNLNSLFSNRLGITK